MTNEIMIPTHVGTGHVDENDHYTNMVWLRIADRRWVQHDCKNTEQNGWSRATGKAQNGSWSRIGRVSGVRETTHQDKLQWLREQIDPLEAVRAGLREEQKRLQALHDEAQDELGSLRRACRLVHEAIEEATHTAGRYSG